jgi:hypothetical protein
VFAARSSDDGRTFSREVQVNPEATGACGCCALRAYAQADGRTFILYRAATESIDRNMTLLMADKLDGSFHMEMSQPWQSTMCPMSSAFLALGKEQVFACWENGSQVYFTTINSQKQTGRAGQPIAAPGVEKKKHPVLANNRKGEMLLVWTEGTGWQKGGSVAWQMYGLDGKPEIEKGRAEGLPVWGLAAAFARADGQFVVLY